MLMYGCELRRRLTQDQLQSQNENLVRARKKAARWMRTGCRAVIFVKRERMAKANHHQPD
ncbi:hypothetical protein ABE38_17540 [Brevibacillus agri]|nr:hypothetical protein [Brevibacillus agri]